jgi:hypothetical protein
MTVPALDLDSAAAPDPSETSRLSEAIERLLPALEQFNRFEGMDQAAHGRESWLAALERELPEQGCGLDEVLRELAEVAIPNGLPERGLGGEGPGLAQYTRIREGPDVQGRVQSACIRGSRGSYSR